MSTFHRNDRVHLKPAFVAIHSYKHHKTAVDWAKREGTVSGAKRYVHVLWDGTTRTQQHDARELEKV